MNSNSKQPNSSRLCRYTIACSDMYYTELEQRDVFVRDDPEKGFQIWGEVPAIGASSTVELCQIFLEYAMYCQTWGSHDEAIYNIQNFGGRLVLALAKFMQDNPPAETSSCKGACALMCLLDSMKVQLNIEQIGAELRFIFAECPLVETAERTGLREVDLALYGVNAMAQSLINTIDPKLTIHTPRTISQQFIYAVEMAS